jgi:DNA-binding NarL/FixJ family response regulator
VQRVISTGTEPVQAEAEFDEDERQILRLLVDGASNNQIAATLYLSETSVKRKLRKIFAVLKVQTRTQAVAEAVRRGLV